MTDQQAPLVIVQPEAAPSFWQPVPANGFVRCLLAGAEIGAGSAFSMGTQQVDAGCFIREHVHPEHDEVIMVLEGQGEALLDGQDRAPMVKGTCLFIGRGRAHRFDARGDAPMTLMWLMMPGGLEHFFARIGRERRPGEPQPPNFPRPADVLQIEAETVFGTLPPA